MLARARLWLRSVVLRRRLEREMQEEMAAHLERAAERLMARGLAPDEARRQAIREFGNVAFLQEQGRDARGARWVEALVADARFALRHFARTPGTTLVMFAVLAMGIGISTLLFSAVHSFALQAPSGVARADDLVRIRGLQDSDVSRRFAEDEFRAYRALGDHFRAMAGWSNGWLPLVLSDDAERRSIGARVTFVTENYFSVLGLRPVIGLDLPAAGADGAASAFVAVIGYGTWEHLFGRDPCVIGSTVTVDGMPVTIVGVAPERFHGISDLYARVQLWMPLAAQRHLMPDPSPRISAVARLHPGVALHSASAAVQVVADRIAATDDTLRALQPSAEVVPLLAMNESRIFEQGVRVMAFLVGLLALLVLLVTCTNVSALLMGLAAARRQEIAIRLSLGAARARLVRQLLTESVLLAAAAGATALGLVWLVLRAVTRLIPLLPFEIALTWPATTFTFGVALAVGVAFGLAPALHGTRVTLAGALHDSVRAVAGGRNRLQRSLVVAQVTFTQPLIAALVTVLLLTLAELQPPRRTELGDQLITVQLHPSPSAMAEPEALRAMTRRLMERLQATPGIAATLIDWRGASPLGYYAVHPEDRVAGASQEAVRLFGERTASGYFAAMGIPVVRGREFAPTEVAAIEPRPSQVGVVIGADLARRLWADASPVGRRLQAASDTARGARTLTVVGVIDDPMADTRTAGERVRVYLPPDTTRLAHVLLLRTTGAASSLLSAVRAAVHEETDGMLAGVQTLAEIEHAAQRNRRLAANGLSVGGVMALFLSAIGLYAVVAFSVSQRTREIAVRMAVGAPGGRIVRRFVADGVRLGAMGLALGLPLSLLGLRALLAIDDDFPALRMIGPITATTAFGALATAVVAAWLPARRAARVDPAVTLRAE